MKSATTIAYVESLAAHKAAASQLRAAKIAIVEDVKQQVLKTIAGLLPTYPQLAYVMPGRIVDTAFNSARKRPKPEFGAIFFHFSINPRWKEYGLVGEVADEINISFHPHHKQVVSEIIRQIEAKGEWKMVEGSIFCYDDGPGFSNWSDWAMIPV